MTRYAARTALLALLLLAFGLRLYRLDHQELRGDEAFGYFFSLRAYDEIISATIELQEPHPVASYFVQKAWLGLAGHGEFALRYVNIWFGVLAVALIYRFGRRLGLTTASALAAAALLTISPYIIWHAQDARMYSMSLALTLASTWLAVEWLARDKRSRRWLWALGYIAVSWLALHTHYFAAFVLMAQYLYVVGLTLWRRQWRTLAAWLLLQGAVFVLYLPWLIRAAQTLTGYGGNGDSPGFVAMAQRSLAVFAAGESAIPQQRAGLALLALLLLLAGHVAAAAAWAGNTPLGPAALALPGRAAAGHLDQFATKTHLQRTLSGGGCAALLSAHRCRPPAAGAPKRRPQTATAALHGRGPAADICIWRAAFAQPPLP